VSTVTIKADAAILAEISCLADIMRQWYSWW
jgi:hypothetical protein